MTSSAVLRGSLHTVVLDREHELLAESMARLEDALARGRGMAAAPSILRELAEYAVFTFCAEQRIMSWVGYPERHLHTAQHHAMQSRLRQLGQMCARGEMLAALQLLNFLREWRNGHIAVWDARFQAFLRDQGVNT